MKREKVKSFVGVYVRKSSAESRRFLGKPDRCYDIVYRNAEGKQIWEKVGWASEGYSAAIAANLRAERVRSIRHGEDLPSEKRKQDVTFGEAWKEFDKWQEVNLSRPKDNQCRYKCHIQNRFENTPLKKISPFELEKLKSELLKAGKSPATVKHVLALIRAVFNRSKTWGLFEGENPVSSVKLPKLNNRRERFLSKEESEILLKELQQVSPVVRDMAFLSLFTGLRAGEIFNLKKGHLDFDNGTILVADSKTGFSRNVYMTESVKIMLKSYQKGKKPDDFVFLDREGNQIDRISHTFSRVVDKLKWNEGISDRRQRVTFHTLRHTFASWLAIQGTPIFHIKELMGHQTLAMTERYSHLIPDVKREAVMGLDGFLR